MTNLPFTQLVKSLPATVPFVGPETQERQIGRPFRARLGANESVFGPSPRAIDAMREAASSTWQYGDPENHDLKAALAAHHNIAPENIVVGEGIDGLLGYIARMFVSQDTPVVTSLGAYPTFNYHVAGFGGRIETVPFAEDHENPQALIAKANECQAPLIYFANPDNPMGTWHNAATVQTMIDAVPETAVLCLDEAYIEFAPEGTAPELDVTNANVVRFRTFSKAYGMAGARIGYCIAEKNLARAFNKVRNHFGVNRIAQAGALAALEDQAYLKSVQQQVQDARVRIADIVMSNGLTSLPSATNFVAIDCGHGGDYAADVLQSLTAAGVFARKPFVAPQDRCIRISASTPADLDLFESEFPRALAAISSE